MELKVGRAHSGWDGWSLGIGVKYDRGCCWKVRELGWEIGCKHNGGERDKDRDER